GTVNNGTAWVCNNIGDIIIGTTDISFAKMSQSGAYFAGNGLTLEGNSISIGTGTNSGLVVNSNDIQLSVAGVTLEIAGNALQINNQGVTNAKIATDAVTLGLQTTGNYVATVSDSGAGTIDVTGSGSENANVTVELADNAVSTTKIQDDAVNNDKLSNNSVNTSNIANSAVTTSKIQDKNVTLAKFANAGANQVLTTDTSGVAQWQNKTIFVSSTLPNQYVYAGNASNTAEAAANLPVQALPTGGNWTISSNLDIDSNTLVVDQANDRVGIGVASPSALLHLKAGTATANTAPLKFTSGTDLTTPEDGALEFGGGALKFTRALWARKDIAYTDSNPPFVAPRQFSFFLDDFDTVVTTAMVWTANNNGGTQAVGTVTNTDRTIGFMMFRTGTTATGRSCLQKTGTGFVLGVNAFYCESRVRIPTLSLAAQEFGFAIGLHDDVNLNAIDGVYFLYDRLNYGTNWQCVTSNNSTRTVTNSGITIIANTWYSLAFTVNAAGTAVNFYINGNLVATNTTNIPTGAGRETGPRILLLKSSGTTQRIVHVDYWLHKIVYTNPR
ncbi:MAG: LamG-like jellyroll fold domain-containing protein, partial [Candidatus Nanoarchaeia archaeon]